MGTVKQNLVYLKDNLANIDRVLLYLVQNDILSLDESEDIRKEATSSKQNYQLLMVLLRRDISRELFLEVLRNTKNERCANKIEGLLPDANTKLEKPKILKNRWWPDKRVLIKNLLRRKIGDQFLIEELHERFLNDENRMLVICESANASKLTGLGGLGKTLTANWYAHNFENEYEHVLWIESGEGSLLTSFQKLARDLKIECRNEFIGVEDYSRKCYEALEEFKCLWVFDDAENYKDEHGIKDVLPKYKVNFYCLITSRWTEWGTKNIGYGEISRLELNIFEESESMEFFTGNLKPQIKYTENDIKELSRLLGNLPLAMQLAVAALNDGKTCLKNYIEKTCAKDIGNIVEAKFDDYEKTINASYKITLELFRKKNRLLALEYLNIFGYIRPDNIDQGFLTRIFSDSDAIIFTGKIIKSLTKYSLISQVRLADDESNNDGPSKMPCKTLLSVHRLLQQVIRHNARKTERDILRKIFRCKGYLDLKLIPFTKYADDELRQEFPKIRTKLLDQNQLYKFLFLKKFDESVQLAEFIDKEMETKTTKFNYALCLEKNGQMEEAGRVLEELNQQSMKEEKIYSSYYVSMEMLKLEEEVTKELVEGHLLIILWRLGNKSRVQEMLEKRKKFQIIQSQDALNASLGILSSNLITSNYYLRCMFSFIILQLDSQTKQLKIFNPSLDVSLLPSSIQKLTLSTTQVYANGEMEWPNLKYLSLEQMPSSCLPHFYSVQLTHIDLLGIEEVNADLLPKTVKNVKISNFFSNTKVIGGVRKLDKLILGELSLAIVDQVLSVLQPKLLVLHYDLGYGPEVLLSLKNQQIKTIALGPIDWRFIFSFSNSIVSKHVDKKSEYYLLEGGRGKAIEKKEFYELIEFTN